MILNVIYDSYTQITRNEVCLVKCTQYGSSQADNSKKACRGCPMLSNMDKGSFVSGHGVTRDVAKKFGVSDRTVRNIFSQYKQQIEEGVSTPDMGTKRKKSGRKLQFTESLKDDIECILQDFAYQCRYCSIDRLLGHLQELGHKL